MSHLAKQWERIGKSPHHGINAPLFFLLSEKSCGIGEYLDLIPLGEWCREIGFDIIQTLPLNDTGKDKSPYNSLSAFALNPIHISLRQLPHAESFQEELAAFLPLNQGRRVQYETVVPMKEEFLKIYFKKYGDEITDSEPFKNFLSEQRFWLESYCLFKVLKEKFHYKNWKDWEGYSHVDAEGIQRFSHQFQAQTLFYAFCQFLCYQQLKEAKESLNKMGIFLKGDIPILISPDSADVWARPELFESSLSAGAPPDMYAEEGQNWGFPLYHWETHEKEGFTWWKKRLAFASNFYDLYRLDHIIGFFRIWAIPKEKKATEGFFIPDQKEEWICQGRLLLKELTESCPMLPIGEDLGVIPPEVRKILTEFEIPGTKVLRWEREWEKDQSFIPLSNYPKLSMSTLSTHDSETLDGWWKSEPDAAHLFCDSLNLNWSPQLSYELQMKILKETHKTESYFHINLIQEYFFLFDDPTLKRIGKERINTPGILSKENWTLRTPITIETIKKNPSKDLLRDLLSSPV